MQFINKSNDLPPAISTKDISKEERFIPTLDGWRAVAIIAVLTCHGISVLFSNPKIHAILATGAFGVQIFFCISGFLITKRLLIEYQTKNSINLKEFYIKRFFRILPVSTLYIAVVFLLEPFFVYSIEPKSYFSSLFFFKNFLADKSWYLSHFWSLSTEEQFYLLWPVLLVTFTVKRGMSILLFSYLCLLLLSKITSLYGHDYIITGCLMAFVQHYYIKNYISHKLQIQSIQILLFATMILGFINKIPERNLLLPWIIGLLILSTVVSPQTHLSRILEFDHLKTIGRYSYSIYIWQQLFCVMESKYIFFPPLQQFPLNFFALAGVSYVSYKYIEQPFIQLGRKLVLKHRRETNGRI
jgi:peptidoglycan/LPS O-acetylase OafA/YrhL